MPSDDQLAALVLDAQRGDSEAFEALARAYLRAAYAVALAIVRRVSDAEDVAQDSVVIAFERIQTCREPARFGAWLLQITRNQARNWLARRKLRDVPDTDAQAPVPDSDRAPPQPLLRQRLVDALGELSETRREVVLLHDLEGWTHPEIARALGISEVMSRQHLLVARRSLRQTLGEAPS